MQPLISKLPNKDINYFANDVINRRTDYNINL